MKRNIAWIMLIVICLGMLTGCGEVDILENMNGDVTDRFKNTKEATEILYNQNFITKESYDSINNNIANITEIWEELVDNADDIDSETAVDALICNDSMNIVKACSAIQCFGDNIGKKESISDYIMMRYWTSGVENGGISPYNWVFNLNAIEKSNHKDIIPNIGNKPTLYNSIAGYEEDKDNNIELKYINGNKYAVADTSFEAIEIVPDNILSDINNAFNFPIYVLRYDLDETLGSHSLDTLYEKIKGEFCDNKGNIRDDIDINDAALDKYFYPAFVNGDTGDILTLKKLCEKNNIYWDNILLDTTWNPDTINSVGEDLVVTQTVNNKTIPVLSIRLKEYNQNAIKNLMNALGIFNSDGIAGKYVVSRNPKDNDGRIYLIEYPVSAIESFQSKKVKVNNNKEQRVVANFTDAGIGINILTGNIIKYDIDSNGVYLPSGVYLKDPGKYYTSALFDDKSGNSSFSILGYNKDVTLDLSSAKVNKENKDLGKYNILTTRIILNDYLEATYAPGYNEEDSKVVVFGRKIRMHIDGHVGEAVLGTGGNWVSIDYYTVTQNELAYKIDEEVAIYVDKDGNKQIRTLKITDFCGIEELQGIKIGGNTISKDTVYRVAGLGEESGRKEAIENTYSNVPDPLELCTILIDINKEEDKQKKIKVSKVFPSETLGNEDYRNYVNSTDGLPNQQRFWVMAVNTGIFRSGLLEFWIGAANNHASLIWWNEYLKESGFVYNVSLEDTNDYILANYKSHLKQSGVFIIDLETIKDITDMYEKEEDIKRVKTIRTAFMIIGWGIIVIALILMLVWVIDTNTDLGLGLMDKITFGYWTAVKYDSDIPTNSNGHTYLTSGKMLVRSLILIAVGILVIKVDIINIVHMLISLFGDIAAELEKIIKGVQ